MSSVCRKRDASGHIRYETDWRMHLYYEFELEDQLVEDINDFDEEENMNNK